MASPTTGPTDDAPVLKDVRILVVTVVHDPADARIRYRQIPALQRAGARITYAAPFTAYGRAVPDGVHGIDLPRALGRRRLRALLAARRLVHTEGPEHDLVLLHDPELLATVPGLPKEGRVGKEGRAGKERRAGREWRLGRNRRTGEGGPTGRPVVVWDVHEDTSGALATKDWLPRPLRGAAAWLVRRAERWAEGRCRLLLAEYGYVPMFRRSHPVVPNSTIVPEREPSPPGDDRVVYLGRINRSRGGEEMVALARALGGTPMVELIGPADADVADAVRSAHEDGVLVHAGFVPNDEALSRLDGALAGLSMLHDHPNHARSRPTKLMEYMAHGLPVITTANPDSAEFVRTYDCGLVVPFGDVPAAACAVRALAGDPVRRRELAAHGRAAAVAEFDWRADGARFAAVLAEWTGAAERR